MKIEKCKICDYKLTYECRPQAIFTIKLPFFGERFCIWDWDHKELVCLNCEIELSENHKKDIYNQIAGEAGRRGYEAGLSERNK